MSGSTRRRCSNALRECRRFVPKQPTRPHSNTRERMIDDRRRRCRMRRGRQDRRELGLGPSTLTSGPWAAESRTTRGSNSSRTLSRSDSAAWAPASRRPSSAIGAFPIGPTTADSKTSIAVATAARSSSRSISERVFSLPPAKRGSAHSRLRRLALRTAGALAAHEANPTDIGTSLFGSFERA
jgi:hypothetical protein